MCAQIDKLISNLKQMDSCSTKDCTNAPTVFISSSETLYCTSCSVYLNHDISDGRIGSLNCTKAYLFVCEELIKNTKGYIQEQELKSRWRKEYNQLKEFNSKLTEYKKQLLELENEYDLKSISLLQKKCSTLKRDIIESEAVITYLKYKMMNELRLDHIKSSKESINELDSKSSSKDTKQSSCETEADLSKIEIRKLQKQLKESNENFEEKKKKEVSEIKDFYEGKIKIIKEEIKNDREAKIKEYLANTEEIYDIVEETKKLCSSNKDGTYSIPYDVLNALWEKIVRTKVIFNLSTNLDLYLDNEEHMKLLKILSHFVLPHTNNVVLRNISLSSMDVKEFLKNSLPDNQNALYFNNSRFFMIDVEKYFDELKVAALKCAGIYLLDYCILDTNQFCKLISYAKNVIHFYVRFSKLTTDEECDFGDDMEDCRIANIYLNSTGDRTNSGWNKHPERFENIVIGISKCTPFKKSLKNITLAACELTIEQARAILDKHGLNGVVIAGL